MAVYSQYMTAGRETHITEPTKQAFSNPAYKNIIQITIKVVPSHRLTVMAHPQNRTGAPPGRMYSVKAILLASVVIAAAFVVVGAILAYPIAAAVLLAGAMVGQRLREEVRLVRERAPDSLTVHLCIPGTERCVYLQF